MKNQVFEKRTRIPASREALYAWHATSGALQRLTPPWVSAEVVRQTGGINDGAEVVLEVRQGPLPTQWHMRHQNHIPGHQFEDIQLSGPFAYWKHTHRFLDDGPDASILEDHIEYRLPVAPFGQLVAGGFVRGELARLFAYRHAVTQQDLASQASQREEHPMKIAISGATGLVGKALSAFLTSQGHEIYRLVRSQPKGPQDIHWDYENSQLDIQRLEGMDVVVHLAGDNIAQGRWNEEKKRRIRESRTEGTRFLTNYLAKLHDKPKVFVCASAIGFYGGQRTEPLTETSSPGSDFLATVCQDWEAAAAPARDAGIRTVNMRFGIILSTDGGALKQMLPPFLVGAGGPLGSGKQMMSWVVLDDVVGAINHAIVTDGVSGPVNVVAPNAVTNSVFTKTLGKVLFRPAIAPVPPFALHLLFGEMADALLLCSQNVKPAVLEQTGYSFRYPQLEGALRHTLGK